MSAVRLAAVALAAWVVLAAPAAADGSRDENAARWPGVAVTASSQYDAVHAAANACDGGPAEWASRGEQNPWIRLAWDEPLQADRIVLSDRPGVDHVNAGTLIFSDGSAVAVSDVPPGGEPKTVTFPMKRFEWVRFQVEAGSGPNVGLTELEVHAVPRARQARRQGREQ